MIHRRAQAKIIQALGGDEIVCTEDEDLRARLHEITDGKGIEYAIDCVAGEVGREVVRNLAPTGMMVQFGALSSHRQTDPAKFVMPVFSPKLIYSSASVHGWWIPRWLKTEAIESVRDVLADLLKMIADARLTLPPTMSFQMDRFQEAMTWQTAGRQKVRRSCSDFPSTYISPGLSPVTTAFRDKDRYGMNEIAKIYTGLAALDHVGIFMLRGGLIIVLLWIGGLKFAKYEGESIVPLVSNSPLMGFFYRYASPAYRVHTNREGDLNPANRAWNEANGTYRFSHGLGAVIVLIGLMIAVSPLLPQVATIGSLLLAFMSCTTLSFLVTTPEAWVPATGDSTHGFPYLSGVGRLIVKDVIMLGAAIVTMSDSAKALLR